MYEKEKEIERLFVVFGSWMKRWFLMLIGERELKEGGGGWGGGDSEGYILCVCVCVKEREKYTEVFSQTGIPFTSNKTIVPPPPSPKILLHPSTATTPFFPPPKLLSALNSKTLSSPCNSLTPPYPRPSPSPGEHISRIAVSLSNSPNCFFPILAS